jgi:hypothetical protein
VRGTPASGSSGWNDWLCGPDRCFRLRQNLHQFGAGTYRERPLHSPLRGPGARHFDRAINSAIIAVTGRKTTLSVSQPLGGDLAALPGKLAFTAWRTRHKIASNAEALLFGQPNFLSLFEKRQSVLSAMIL